jgi:YaiO family outer membrane protein
MTMLAFLVTAMLVQAPSAIDVDRVYDESVAQARAGDYTQALAGFQQIVATVPGHHDARVWIARLQTWQGDRDAAAATYQSVLNENPRHVDAMVGLGNLFINLGRREDARLLLANAEEVQPENAEVMAALARLHRLAGDWDVALAYIARAAQLSPTAEMLQAQEQIRRLRGHRLEIGGFHESLSRLPSGHSFDAALSLRVHERLRVVGRVQRQQKFGDTDTRFGGGIDWRPAPATFLAVSFMGGPGNGVLAQSDVAIDVTHYRGAIEWAVGFHQAHFATADVSVLSPGITIALSDQISVGGRYHLAMTDFSGSDRDTSHSALLRGSVTPWRRVGFSVTYARGNEDFETLTIDRIGSFSANTAAAGARVDLSTLTTLSAAYEHQWRSTGITVRRLTFALVQHF